MSNLILIDLHDGPNQWRLKMFQGRQAISEATCPPLSADDLWKAIDGWRHKMTWQQRDSYLPARAK